MLRRRLNPRGLLRHEIVVFTGLMMAGFAQQPGRSDESPARSAVAAQSPQTGVTLMYKFQPNADVHYVVEAKNKITVQKNGEVETTESHSMTERHFHVREVNEGVATLDTYIDAVHITQRFNNDEPKSYDSRKVANPPVPFMLIARCVGRRLGELKATRSGKFVSLLDFSGDAAVAAADPAQNFLSVVPDGPVRIGDAWLDDFDVKVKVSQKLTQKVTLRRRYTLQSVDGPRATIRVATFELRPTDDPQIKLQLLQRTHEGTIVFDIERGLIVSHEIRAHANEVGLLGPGSAIASSFEWTEKLVDAPQIAKRQDAGAAATQ